MDEGIELGIIFLVVAVAIDRRWILLLHKKNYPKSSSNLQKLPTLNFTFLINKFNISHGQT